MHRYRLTASGRWLLVLGLALALAACAGKTRVESDLGLRGAPDWVNEGTQLLNDRGGRLFHGIGEAPTMGDDSLQRATADDRARAELARILSSYLEVVGNDYSAAAGEMLAQQSVSREIRSLTRVNLSGARIIARWRDRKSGTLYALAELDMERISANLAALHDMDPDLRRYISAEGANIFDRLLQETP